MLETGTYVRALVDLIDVDSDGTEYHHARPGTVGVVAAYDEGCETPEGIGWEDYPIVDFSGDGHGACNCIVGVHVEAVPDKVGEWGNHDFSTEERGQ